MGKSTLLPPREQPWGWIEGFYPGRLTFINSSGGFSPLNPGSGWTNQLKLYLEPPWKKSWFSCFEMLNVNGGFTFPNSAETELICLDKKHFDSNPTLDQLWAVGASFQRTPKFPSCWAPHCFVCTRRLPGGKNVHTQRFNTTHVWKKKREKLTLKKLNVFQIFPQLSQRLWQLIRTGEGRIFSWINQIWTCLLNNFTRGAETGPKSIYVVLLFPSTTHAQWQI